MKIYTTAYDAAEATKIFSKTFKNKDSQIFISRDYFNTIEEHEKARFVESQITYQQTYRTLSIKGLKNVDIPTKITDSKNINLSIKE
jgi:hypothetical protein